MSTRRYSGRLTIRIDFDDRDDCYRGSVCADGKRQGFAVRAPAFTEIARDAPAAYDAAAHAAISFAVADLGWDPDATDWITPAAETGEKGWIVRRTKQKRRLRCPAGHEGPFAYVETVEAWRNVGDFDGETLSISTSETHTDGDGTGAHLLCLHHVPGQTCDATFPIPDGITIDYSERC
jgi:hypothetical protein